MPTPVQRIVASPLGTLYLVASPQGLQGVLWRNPRLLPGEGEAGAILTEAAAQLDAYFSGQRQDFSLPLDAQGSLFQRRVWQQLDRIPYAQTRSYLQIASSLGDKNACRAVGAANGRNPLAIITPCHRVIASDGTLGGYAGGLDIKRWLLAHETRYCGASSGEAARLGAASRDAAFSTAAGDGYPKPPDRQQLELMYRPTPAAR